MNGKRSSRNCAAAGCTSACMESAATAISARPSSTKAVQRARRILARQILMAIEYHDPGGPGHRSSARKTCQFEDELARPQPLENRHSGKAIRHNAAAGLEIP